MELQLLGQPKTGTTWLELVLFKLAERCPSSNGCRMVGGAVNRSQRRAFTLHTGGQQLELRTLPGEKHLFPPREYATPCDRIGGSGLEWLKLQDWLQRNPCGLSATSAVNYEAIDRCASRCGAASARARTLPPHPQIHYVHIERDPRRSALSACHFYPKLSQLSVQECLEKVFPLHAAWASYRSRWLARNADLARRTTRVTYEAMLATPEVEYAKLASGALLLSGLDAEAIVSSTAFQSGPNAAAC